MKPLKSNEESDKLGELYAKCKKIGISIDQADYDYLKRLGCGYVSVGVRFAVRKLREMK